MDGGEAYDRDAACKKNKKDKGGTIYLNLAWYLFYGRKLGMQKNEILCTPLGEMMDMLTCMAISNGALVQKPPLRTWDYDAAMALR